MTTSPFSPSQVSPAWDSDALIKQLHIQREGLPQRTYTQPLPSRHAVQDMMMLLCSLLFPSHFRLNTNIEPHKNSRELLDQVLSLLFEQIKLECSYHTTPASPQEPQRPLENWIIEKAQQLVIQFSQALPVIQHLLDTDVLAAFRGDPAAHSIDEVILCYPGMHAMIYYRIAHQLYRQNCTLLARLITELAHSATGIDIHPGAQIDQGFFIDHGTGVVIGETAIIGKHVRLYQAVTLGAKRFEADAQGLLVKGLARHPIVEDHVVIYAGATILGRITIGHHSTIGGNVWLTYSVPPGSQITQAHSQQAHQDIPPHYKE